MRDGGSALRQQFHFLCIEVDAVGQREMRPQRIERGEMDDRALAGFGQIEIGVRRISAHVRGHAAAGLAGQRRRFAPQRISRGVVADQTGPARQQRIARSGPARKLVFQLGDSARGHSYLIVVRRKGPVLHPLANASANPCGGKRIEDGREVEDRSRLDKTCRARAQHFQCRERRRQRFVLGRLRHVGRDQPVEDIGPPIGIVGHRATRDRLASDVDMAVHEAWRDHEAVCSLDHFAGRNRSLDFIGRP